MGAFNFEITSREIGSKDTRKWDLKNDANGKLSLKRLVTFVNGVLVRVTNEVLKEELNRGFPTEYVEITDGVVGKPYVDVDITKRGTIEITAQESIEDLVKFIYETVTGKSKIVTGRYEDSNIMLYNRSEVASTTSEALKWARTARIKQGDTIQFLNFQPYARRLERMGVTAQKSRPKLGKVRNSKKNRASTRVGFKPNGVYYLTSLLARKKFSKGVGKIKFEFITGETSISNASDISRNTFAGDGRKYLYPSIIVVFDTRGLK